MTLAELQSMSVEDHAQLLSVCYKYGEHRCECVGIRDLFVETGHCPLEDRDVVYINWSDDDGDPNVKFRQSDSFVTDLYGFDRKWTYGLFKAI